MILPLSPVPQAANDAIPGVDVRRPEFEPSRSRKPWPLALAVVVHVVGFYIAQSALPRGPIVIPGEMPPLMARLIIEEPPPPKVTPPPAPPKVVSKPITPPHAPPPVAAEAVAAPKTVAQPSQPVIATSASSTSSVRTASTPATSADAPAVAVPTAPAAAVAPPTVAAIAPPRPDPVAAEPEPVSPPRFDAAYLNNPTPSYPSLSRRSGDQGKVLLRVRVSTSGRAEEIELKTGSGFPRLDEAALATVRQWRFAPARQGDKAIAAWVVVPIVFKLDS